MGVSSSLANDGLPAKSNLFGIAVVSGVEMDRCFGVPGTGVMQAIMGFVPSTVEGERDDPLGLTMLKACADVVVEEEEL